MTKPILAATLSISSHRLTDDEKFLLEKSNPVGITLFGRNIKNKSQIKNLIKELKEVIGRDDILIAVDQEGGRVRRLTPPKFRNYAANIEIASLSFDDARKASQLHGELISHDLKELGINVNFAPVLDRLHKHTNEALKSRCFSNDVTVISSLGKIMVDTYIKNGILPCIKHLPGHGNALSDPHLCLPSISLNQKEYEEDLIPFIKNNHSPLAMTAHIVVPFIDAQNPITQSKTGIQNLIRQKIGFNGFLISDAIDMRALKGSVSQKAIKSLDAGCDCVCYAMGKLSELQELSDNCPKLSDDAQQRLDKALQILHNKHKHLNIKHLSDEYSKLLTHITPYQESYDATEVLSKLQSKE